MGNGNLFHIAELRELNRISRDVTKIEDQTAPGILPAMVNLAKEVYPSGTPFNISSDERGVGSMFLYILNTTFHMFNVCRTSQLPTQYKLTQCYILFLNSTYILILGESSY